MDSKGEMCEDDNRDFLEEVFENAVSEERKQSWEQRHYCRIHQVRVEMKCALLQPTGEKL